MKSIIFSKASGDEKVRLLRLRADGTKITAEALEAEPESFNHMVSQLEKEEWNGLTWADGERFLDALVMEYRTVYLMAEYETEAEDRRTTVSSKFVWEPDDLKIVEKGPKQKFLVVHKDENLTIQVKEDCTAVKIHVKRGSLLYSIHPKGTTINIKQR